MSAHLSTWSLRRLHAGELDQSPEQSHLTQCADCSAQLRELEQGQRDFEKLIPYDRFAEGVARKRASAQAPLKQRSPKHAPSLALAASLLLAVIAGPLLKGTWPTEEFNRRKGGATMELRIGGGIQQRLLTAGNEEAEPLAAGERVRLGYAAQTPSFLVALSVDEQGEVSPLYPTEGEGLQVLPSTELAYLPESVEFTGKGLERVILVLSTEPLNVERALQAAQESFAQAQGQLKALQPLPFAGEQNHWLLLKP